MYNTITHPTWLSIVFENRNQTYGAFQLRKEYEKNLIGGLLLSHGSVIGFFALLWAIHSYISPSKTVQSATDIPYQMIEVVLPPKIELPKQVLPKNKTIIEAASKRFVKPNVVSDAEPDASTLATTDELDNKSISSTDVEGKDLVQAIELPATGTNLAVEPSSTGEVVRYAELMPNFPAAYGRLNSYLSSKIVYPREALANGISGKVLVEFTVDEEGNIINPSIVRSLGYGCDEEVLRVLASMPKWTPGAMNNKPVKVRLTIPVNFRLAE